MDTSKKEKVYALPAITGEYLRIFNTLKAAALSEALDGFEKRFGVSYRLRRKKNRSVRNPVRTGYLAFKIYYAEEFYNLPMRYAAKYYSAAWNACPYKQFWEYYSLQYNSIPRRVGFKDWLDSCEKIDIGNRFIVTEITFT